MWGLLFDLQTILPTNFQVGYGNPKNPGRQVDHFIDGGELPVVLWGDHFLDTPSPHQLHSGKLTWQCNIPFFNRKHIFEWSIVHCHVSLPEGILDVLFFVVFFSWIFPC